jgi:hypothetical protein
MNYPTESILNGSRLVPTRNRHTGSGIAWRRPSVYLVAVVAKLRDFAPYAAIELVLPGGSLIALLLWFYRRRQKANRAGPATRAARRSSGVLHICARRMTC